MIRLATLEDLPYLVEMTKTYHGLSPFKDRTFDTDKVSLTLQSFIPTSEASTIIVQVDEEDKPVGMLAAVCQTMLFGPNRQACELIWWVNPEHRGKEAFELLKAYEYWAKEVANSAIAILSTLDPGLEKVYEGRGYICCERAFMKELR